MGKNNNLINTYKRLERIIKEITPNLYSAFGLVLHRKYGWSTDDIAELFGCVHEVWDVGVNESHNLIKEFEDEVDIIICSE